MADFRLPPPDRGERIYRALLHLYPARFRHNFELDLVEAFRDQRRDAARRGLPAVAFWLAAMQDLVTQAAVERAAATFRAPGGPGRPGREDSPMSVLLHALRSLELRQASRRLARVPLFALTTVLVLALGIGATTAMFGVVNGVLLRPLPYVQPERLVSLTHTLDVPGISWADQSEATLLLYQRHARAFDGIAAWRVADVNFTAPGGQAQGAERLGAASVTANFLDVLRVAPRAGRGFIAGEDRIGAAPVVIISHGLWQRRFAGAPDVIGRAVTVDGTAREIVGVMPERFAYPSRRTELWVPLALDPSHAAVASFNYVGVGRLQDGVSIDGARADLDRALPRLLDEFPSEIPRAMWEQARVRAAVTPLRDAMIGGTGRLLWLLLGSVALVLVIACANVANLFLVRGESRQRELAVRGALGAGLGGMIAQCLAEALVLAACGGAMGLALAAGVMGLVRRFGGALGVPRLHEIGLDANVTLFALLVSLFCAAAVSLVPALRARRLAIASVLRDAGRGATEGVSRVAARHGFVVAQVALALVLVAGSGLLARSFARLRDVKPGIEAERVAMARIALPRANYQDDPAAMRFYDRLLARVRALPGVQDATVTTWVPLGHDHDDTVIGVEDHPLPPGAVPRVHFVATVDSTYFRTMGVPLLRGRTLGPQDPAAGVREAVVSDAFARRYWPGVSPLGRRIRPGLDTTWYTIVGVVGDVHFEALDEPAEDAVYFPLQTADRGVPRNVALLVRAAGAPSALTPQLRRVVGALDPTLPTFDERPLADVVEAASARARLTMTLLGTTSALALVLGAIGMYGVMAYGVSLRRREIGVRLALGARPSDVRGMISRQGVVLGGIGVVIGIVCALALTRLLAGLLYGVSPTDPLTLVGTCAVLLLVSLAASWLPARRAAALDPATALRTE